MPEAYSEKELSKMCKSAMREFLADCPEGIDFVEDAAYELARALIFMDARVRAFFMKSGINRRHWAEALAEYYLPV